MSKHKIQGLIFFFWQILEKIFSFSTKAWSDIKDSGKPSTGLYGSLCLQQMRMHSKATPSARSKVAEGVALEKSVALPNLEPCSSLCWWPRHVPWTFGMYAPAAPWAEERRCNIDIDIEQLLKRCWLVGTLFFN